MPLSQAEPSIRETFETSSSGASPIPYEKLWDQSEERTEGASRFEDVEVGFPFSNEKIILDEEDSTRAEGRELLQREQLYRTWQQDWYPSLLETFKEKLRKITEREDNWDGKRSKKPSPLVLSQAHNTLEYFLYSVVNSGRLWKPPFVSSDEDRHITIQWNHGDHELHIEIGEEETEYTKVWGVNIEHEMHLSILKEKDFLNLWDWLSA